MNKKFFFVLIGLVVIIPIISILAAKDVLSELRLKFPLTVPAQETVVIPQSSPTTNTQLANPASENCTAKGGTLIMQKRGDGGEYGLCMFEDAYACEEWALFRGDCPVGGVRTTGFDTVEQKYCAWSGGQTLAVPNAICTFADNSTCSDEALYQGTCKKGDNP